jgi:hypothetical protein
MIPKQNKLATRTNEEWVSDRVTHADHSQGLVLACQEHRCEPMPLHAHSKRPYLVWRHPKR